MPNIYPKKIKNKTYYYYQYSYRVKIDTSNDGKTKGSGKSKVCTKSIFLGTATEIYEKLSQTKAPIEVTYREFGLVAAGYLVAKQIGLIEALKNNIPGERFKTPRWVFFIITILNRLSDASSKEQMGSWAAKTILPELLNIDYKKLNSKTFWYVTDDIISESDLKERRKEKGEIEDDLLTGLEISIFQKIEDEIWPNISTILDKSIESILYDTTNFFTYIEEPSRSSLAKSGHNKDSKHNLKQVGLAMAVEREWGIPLFHRMYKGNIHDSKVFKGIIIELIGKIKEKVGQVNDLVLVIDKGNNSEENFNELKEKIDWVGSLIPSNYKELIEKELTEYTGWYEGLKYYEIKMEVMGIECKVVVTYNEKLARRQEHRLEKGIMNLKKKIEDKYNSYKRVPKGTPKGIIAIKDKDRYGIYINVNVEDKKLIIEGNEEKKKEKKRYFGKNLIFSSKVEVDAIWIIVQYKRKDKVEKDFNLLKSPDIIRFRPIRHWTDTKIYAYGFSCVMSLLLLKIMEIKVEQIGLKMSPTVLKEELNDIKEIIMIYDKKSAERKISRRSSVQEKLWELFELMNLENKVNHTQF